MANILRCLAALLFVSAVTGADCHPARAQTISSDRRQGSSALLDAVRGEQLRAALANEEKSKMALAVAPHLVITFPLPSCIFPGGLCGAINRDGSVAVAPRYDWVDRFYEGRALVRLNGLYGYIDAAGRVVDEPKYESAGTYSDGLAEVSIGGLSALIDLEGRLVLKPKFARALVFTSDAFWVNDGARSPSFSRYQSPPGVARLNEVYANGKWGLIARTGEWIRKPEFTEFGTFNLYDRSVALVKAKAGWGVIRPDGTWLIAPKFEILGHLYNGLAKAQIGGKFGFVDPTGALVIPPKFREVGDFGRDGLSTASIGTLWGLIDRRGAWVVEPRDVFIPHSDDPVVWVQKSGEPYRAIDRSGKLVVAPRFSQPGAVCDDGWAIGVDYYGKRRAVRREGMQLVLPDGDLLGSNCTDPLQLEVDGRFGLLDRALKPLTDVKFDSIAGFFSGAAIARIDGKFGYLNPDGSWLIEPRFEAVENFVGDHAVAGRDGKFGCIGRSGAWEIEPQFQDKFVDCLAVVRLANARPGGHHPGGTPSIDPRIQKIAAVAPGFYTVQLDGKFGVVNDAFDWVIEPRWQRYGMFSSNGVAGPSFSDDPGVSWWEIEPSLRSYGRLFSNGLVAAKFEDKWGIIDASGAMVIDAAFDGFGLFHRGVFERGIAWMQTGSSWCAIDRRGQRVPTLPCRDTEPILISREKF
jgi:WG containing repeat